MATTVGPDGNIKFSEDIFSDKSSAEKIFDALVDALPEEAKTKDLVDAICIFAGIVLPRLIDKKGLPIALALMSTYMKLAVERSEEE